MRKLKVGVIGSGTIAQVEHVPNLLRLNDHFEFSGIYDPSASTRAFMAQTHEIVTFASLSDLLDQPLDAVVIASPDALHKEHALEALNRGLHVFCEKPLCYSPSDTAELIRARDAAKRVLQVGYMKRFDPAYEALIRLLPKSADKLRQISVEVVDADAWPFVLQHRTHRAEDVPTQLIDDARLKQKNQVTNALASTPDAGTYQGFVAAYASSLVHDVNAVHGLLDAMGIADGEIVSANFFGAGRGGSGAIALLGGQALWTMTHLSVSTLPYYSERIALHFEDASYELEFPSPYLNNQPTRLTIRKGENERLITQQIHTGYREAFVEELIGFWTAVVHGGSVRNTAEQAARDMQLLCDLARWQMTLGRGVKS